MAKKLDYASLFTLRKDGLYMGHWRDEKGRHSIYDRDPERLYHRIYEKEHPDTAPPKFKDLAEAWEKEHWDRISYKTAEAYTAPLRRLIDRFGDRETVTSQEIYAFLVELGKKKYSRRSVQMHRDIMNMIFNHAIMAGKMTVNPCAAVSVPRNLTTTRRELPDDAAVEAVKQSACDFSLFAKFCLYAGLRRGEALALRYEDIDRTAKIIHITKAVEYVGNNAHIKTPKTEAGYRDVILLNPLAAAIPEGTGYIFCREDGGLLSKMQYRDRWLDYCKTIGHDLTAHQLRHGFATILYEAGIQDKDAQDLLGHASITTTRNIYTHIRQAHREETAQKLNDFLG